MAKSRPPQSGGFNPRKRNSELDMCKYGDPDGFTPLECTSKNDDLPIELSKDSMVALRKIRESLKAALLEIDNILNQKK